MDTLTATLDRAGRLLIPAQVRAQMGIDEGSKVILRLGPEGLLVMTPRQALERVQALLDPYFAAGRSLADELIAERRREAALE